MAYGFMTIYWRDMIRFVRFKTLLVSSLLQPALWLAFFGIAMASNFDAMMAGMPVPEGAKAVGYLTFMGCGTMRDAPFSSSCTNSYDTIVASIRDRLFRLPDATVVHTGHGESTTIGAEAAGLGRA